MILISQNVDNSSYPSPERIGDVCLETRHLQEIIQTKRERKNGSRDFSTMRSGDLLEPKSNEKSRIIPMGGEQSGVERLYRGSSCPGGINICKEEDIFY